jgi:hypothetical protein
MLMVTPALCLTTAAPRQSIHTLDRARGPLAPAGHDLLVGVAARRWGVEVGLAIGTGNHAHGPAANRHLR